MSNTKSPLEQALLEGQEIMKAARENAKEILASQLQPEIDKIVKESISEAKAEDKKVEETVSEDISSDVKPADDVVISNDEILTGEEDKEESNDAVNVVDMTTASDDDAVEVFKKLESNDEVEVKKDGDNVEITDGDDKYIVKMNENEECDDDIVYELDLSNYMEDETSTDVNDDEVIYEIEIDEESELDEIARTHDAGRSARLKGDQFFKYAKDRTRDGDPAHLHVHENEIKNLNESIKTKNTELTTIKEENESLKADLGKHKEALRTLKENITEVALYNSNLAYTNRLFCEHSTTKDEKINIIKRFDTVKSVDESKTLYKTISEELTSVKPNIEESIENKINKTVSPASSTITESVNSEDAELKRIKQLMSYSNKNR